MDLLVKTDRALIDWAAARRNLGLSDAMVFAELVSAGPSAEDGKVWECAVGNEGGGRDGGDEGVAAGRGAGGVTGTRLPVIARNRG